MSRPTTVHPGPADSAVIRDPAGHIVGGVGIDVDGSWSWWATATRGRRVRASSKAEALRLAGAP